MSLDGKKHTYWPMELLSMQCVLVSLRLDTMLQAVKVVKRVKSVHMTEIKTKIPQKKCEVKFISSISTLILVVTRELLKKTLISAPRSMDMKIMFVPNRAVIIARNSFPSFFDHERCFRHMEA